ncbi:MAG: diacylglyceryl transferase [Oscillochloris sp.]|nr:diacylglyceryl transferase [Oscillochloris sp.]
MYPLIQIGPLNLSSGGLLVLLALMTAIWLSERAAQRRGGGELVGQVSSCMYPTLAGAVIGGRLWYGLLNWDLYGANPGLFLALRVADLAWPGALLGGMLAGRLWCRRKGFAPFAIADAAALGLLPAQAITALGLLLSGEAFGVPTQLPWGLPLFGALRHPTQIYLLLAALLSYGGLLMIARRNPVPGVLFAAYLVFQAAPLLVIEALRADSLLLPYGIRAAQVAGLALAIGGLRLMRDRLVHSSVRTSTAHLAR